MWPLRLVILGFPNDYRQCILVLKYTRMRRNKVILIDKKKKFRKECIYKIAPDFSDLKYSRLKHSHVLL